MTLSPADLPAHLAERVRPTGTTVQAIPGELVLYWMHHAVRAEENPALDTALEAARQLALPLLVYQGLGGSHPHANDRHHTFILEGARDVAAALAGRGIRHVFHLARTGSQPSPLRALAQRASLVITEDFPVPPFTQWTRNLSDAIEAPVWRVDTACILPMRQLDRAYARAFEFRAAHGDTQLRRARLQWPETPVDVLPWQGPLGFEPVNLARADIAALCAESDIDHAVGPVPLTRGGSVAALARWQAFVEQGLASYDAHRNDAAVAPPLGTSRISAYLHHGHLSPLRVARDAAMHGSRGAAKFLDELLIWRELAHNACFHSEQRAGGLASLERLPRWAQDTLREHADDPRTTIVDPERLERGATGDALWDAAQRSLRVHGELHNNLRMTWGKALLDWTASPARALELMIEFNNRYALDGSDPNSYAGLLYCLGLFDRPFSPELPVYGRVRARPTDQHEKRLDLAAFRARCNTRNLPGLQRIAVIGAGIAGLAAARTLHDQGFDVKVFERARGVGGRTAHRRVDEHRFDHGAQYFTARDPRFARQVDAWLDAGVVQHWRGRIAAREQAAHGSTLSPVSPIERFVGVPGMNAIAKHLATDLEVMTACTITALQHEAERWTLTDAHGDCHGPFDALIVAMPPAQWQRLDWRYDVSHRPNNSTAVPHMPGTVSVQSCWCAMVAFDAPLPVVYDGLFANDAVIDWIARDSSKPGRPTGDRWVIHANAAWSADRLDASPDDCAGELLARLFEIIDIDPVPPSYLAGHRWSFARVHMADSSRNATGARAADANAVVSSKPDCLWYTDQALAICGDWCGGGRVEGAFLSGVAAAGRVASAAVLDASAAATRGAPTP